HLRDGKTSLDALRAAFPAGTVSGAPKIRAMEVIAELEPAQRGVYAGALGYVSFGGNLDMAITLRTVVATEGSAYAQAGSAGGVRRRGRLKARTRIRRDSREGRRDVQGHRDGGGDVDGVGQSRCPPRPDRQLRLVHLQPRPVHGRAGCRAGSVSERPGDGRRA